ncbi:MAG TPA: MarR family transcriptional regulator [Chloroflexota bacterium]|nr:MarR family transcriptional regulator [Chloroflexota bacterium]
MSEPQRLSAGRRQFLQSQPTYWLKRCYGAMRRRVDSDLRPFGLTLAQREALLQLRDSGPITQAALAQAIGIEQSSASRLIGGLVRRGFVVVEADEHDRRSRTISVSPEGERVLNQTPGASKLAGGRLTEALSADEMRMLINLLQRCAQALEGDPPETSATR